VILGGSLLCYFKYSHSWLAGKWKLPATAEVAPFDAEMGITRPVRQLKMPGREPRYSYLGRRIVAFIGKNNNQSFAGSGESAEAVPFRYSRLSPRPEREEGLVEWDTLPKCLESVNPGPRTRRIFRRQVTQIAEEHGR
jgi:hypothetical protein